MYEACMHARMHVCMHVCTYVRYVRMYMYTYVCTFVCPFYTRMYIYIYTICMYTYIYIHMYIHLIYDVRAHTKYWGTTGSVVGVSKPPAQASKPAAALGPGSVLRDERTRRPGAKGEPYQYIGAPRKVSLSL